MFEAHNFPSVWIRKKCTEQQHLKQCCHIIIRCSPLSSIK